MSGLKYPEFYPILKDKVVIVTGAAMGMGEATAKLFAAAGAKVLCADHNEEEGLQTVAEITANGGIAKFQYTQIEDSAQVQAMVKTAVDTWGRLDGAVNNAAHVQDTNVAWEFDEDYWDELQAVNIKGTAMCMKYELQYLIEQNQGGSIVNVSSCNSVRPKDRSLAYTTSKHGVMGMTKVASMEAGKYNIRVSCLGPGGINTPMLQKAAASIGKNVKDLGGMSRLGRIGEPEEVAMGNLFLISDMSTYVTGTTLFVDGGHTVL